MNPGPLEVLGAGGFRDGEVHFFGEVSSTMDLVRRGDLPWNATVVAATQTAGRGRYDRRWSSPETGGLYLTTWIRHDRTPEGAANLSQGTALGLAHLCRTLGIADACLKWPNDLLIAGKKSAGILAECFTGDQGMGIAVGVGINVNTAQEILSQVGQPATSLGLEAGRELPMRAVLLEFLRLWSQVDIALANGGFAAIAQEYRSFSDLPGRLFRHSTGKDEELVRVVGISDQGALMIEPVAGGQVRTIWGGELLPA
ncbi:MAG: Bifunctional ligase/repressor BirA [Fibrobacterota bacterium]|jgi:BirA family biotin operon repressor/biotin-[acetyl-CoA-carboxylase] ligase